MTKSFTTASFVCIIVIIYSVIIQHVVPQRCMPQSHGQLFTFAYPPNRDSDEIGLYIQPMTAFATTVLVTVPLHPLIEDITLTLDADEGFYTLDLPSELISVDMSGITPNAVVVESDYDISLIAFNMRDFSIDTFTVVPVEHLSNEYYVVVFPGPRYLASTVLISGLSEPSLVTIRVNARVMFNERAYMRGDVITHALNPYETIQLDPTTIQFTGSRITTNTSVTVVVGSRCANIPKNVYSCDHLAEMLVPFSRWGRTLTVNPFAGRDGGYVYHIVAGRDNTVVEILTEDGSTQVETMQMGEHYLQNVPDQSMRHVTSNQPIQIALYPKTTPYSHRFDGDASLAMVPPHEQFVNHVAFGAPKLPGVAEMYVGVTADCNEIGHILLNDVPIGDQTTAFEKLYRIALPSGDAMCTRWFPTPETTTHVISGIIQSDDDDDVIVRFNAQVFGYGHDVSHTHYPGFNNEVLTCADSDGNVVSCSTLPGDQALISCTVWEFAPLVSSRDCNELAALGVGATCSFSCPTGYILRGARTSICQAGGYMSGCSPTCQNEDECARDASPCDQPTRQNCTDTVGSFNCSCKTGWEEDNGVCIDVDECTVSSPCDAEHGVCTNQDGSFTCGCEPGWTLNQDGRTCSDENECLRVGDAYPCDVTHGRCVNMPGSYRCTCQLRWELGPDLVTCQDVNECLGDSGCVIAPCRNTIGGFVCDPSLPFETSTTMMMTPLTGTGSTGSSVGVIVGSVIGALVGLAFLVAALVCCGCCCFGVAAVPDDDTQSERWEKEMISYGLVANPITNPDMFQGSVTHNYGASRYAFGERAVVFEPKED